MSRKESFRYRQTQPLFQKLEAVSQQAGVSRGKAFEDFLTISVCTLKTGLMDAVSRSEGGVGVRDEEYFQTIEPYTKGKPGNRAIDTFKEMFQTIMFTVEQTRDDILGDLFEGAISYGENGLFLTPEPLTDLMSRLIDDGSGKTVHDPSCGSGRMLLSAAEMNPHREFIGTDKDYRCFQITSINLAIRNLYGYAIWGNTLGSTSEEMHQKIHHTGFNGSSWIREISHAEYTNRLNALESTSERNKEEKSEEISTSEETSEPREQTSCDDDSDDHPRNQGLLF